MKIRKLFLGIMCVTAAMGAQGRLQPVSAPEACIHTATPGNEAVARALVFDASGAAAGRDGAALPVKVTRTVTYAGDDAARVCVTVTALENIWFNYGEKIRSDFPHASCQLLMPGFWYRQNLRSPDGAPSFRVSDSWTVREDRLSTPLTAVYSPEKKEYMSVIRLDSLDCDALSTHSTGNVMVSGRTSVGFTGFENTGGVTSLCYGFPYSETPKSYVRKLTLAPSVTAFQYLAKGHSMSFNWEVRRRAADDFAKCVSEVWEYSYDTLRPQPLQGAYTPARVKDELCNFFTSSFTGANPIKYYAGVELATAGCAHNGVAEIGFLGRNLLNAFNALEYGEANGRADLIEGAHQVYDSYLEHGFSDAGLFKEFIKFDGKGEDPVRSIRRQSEGAYAALTYLDYEKRQGRRHPEWEAKVKGLLDYLITLQNEDGSFPRKFRDDHTKVDASGGSTPSATIPFVMGYKYFKDKRYLAAARRTVDYLDREIISKSDYFSSTLDANCEDKEASLYGATATYYLALVTKGEEHRRCAELTRRAAYFALSWYYTWDVPFAPGQMLGDLGLKTRGWGNVSVENNHIDVFVFEFADVLRWLSKEYGENRFSAFADVISSSMGQLLPHEGHLCGIAKPGYYPEVVQHTRWDYGRNGKGYYNNIFAPGWTVASLWQLYSPGRAEQFLTAKK